MEWDNYLVGILIFPFHVLRHFGTFWWVIPLMLVPLWLHRRWSLRIAGALVVEMVCVAAYQWLDYEIFLAIIADIYYVFLIPVVALFYWLWMMWRHGADEMEFARSRLNAVSGGRFGQWREGKAQKLRQR